MVKGTGSAQLGLNLSLHLTVCPWAEFLSPNFLIYKWE